MRKQVLEQRASAAKCANNVEYNLDQLQSCYKSSGKKFTKMVLSQNQNFSQKASRKEGKKAVSPIRQFTLPNEGEGITLRLSSSKEEPPASPISGALISQKDSPVPSIHASPAHQLSASKYNDVQLRIEKFVRDASPQVRQRLILGFK